MKINSNIYTVKLVHEGNECSFTSQVDMLDNNNVELLIVKDGKDKNMHIILEWIRSYSDAITGRMRENVLIRKDVTLTNINGEQTILYGCILTSCASGENFSGLESLNINYWYANWVTVERARPIKLKIEIDNLTKEQSDRVKEMFNNWLSIIGSKENRWTSFLIDKDFNPNIKIFSD
jgi:hypothetical protein